MERSFFSPEKSIRVPFLLDPSPAPPFQYLPLDRKFPKGRSFFLSSKPKEPFLPLAVLFRSSDLVSFFPLSTEALFFRFTMKKGVGLCLLFLHFEQLRIFSHWTLFQRFHVRVSFSPLFTMRNEMKMGIFSCALLTVIPLRGKNVFSPPFGQRPPNTPSLSDWTFGLTLQPTSDPEGLFFFR